MRSKTSFFNRTVFLKNFTRFWPIWALYLVVWILLMPVALVNEMSYSTVSTATISYQVLTMASYVGLVGALLAGMAAAGLTFSYTFNTRSNSFFASLPIRREGMYLTNYLSGLFWFIAANVIIFLLTLLVTAGSGKMDITVLLQWLAIVSLEVFIFYSMATFSATVAGNAVGFLLIYAALNAGLYVCEALIKLMGTMILKGLTMGSDALTKPLTPMLALWKDLSTRYSASSGALISVKYVTWTPLLIYTGVAVVLVVLGLLIYRKRHMETASDLITMKWMRPVFKYLLTAFCALVLGFILYRIIFAYDGVSAPVIPMTVCMLIGAFIGYFGSSMMLNKSFRVFKNWLGYIVCAVLIIAAMFCVSRDVFGIESYVPKVDNVKSATVNCEYDTQNEFTDSANIESVTKLHSLLIGEEDPNYGVEYRTITINYTLKNGRNVERRYFCNPNEKLNTSLDQLLNSPEAVENRLTTKIPINEQTVYYANVDVWDEDGNYYNFDLTPTQAYEMYETCILPDVEDGNLGRIKFTEEPEVSAGFHLNIELSREDVSGGGSYYDTEFDTLYLSGDDSAARTWKFIQDNIPEDAAMYYGG